MSMLEWMPVVLGLALSLASSRQDEQDGQIEGEGARIPWFLDVSRDGGRVAVAGADGIVELWDPRELIPREQLEPALGSTPWALAFAPDGERLAALAEFGLLVIWDLASTAGDAPTRPGQARQVLSGRLGVLRQPFGAAIAWAPSSAHLAVVESAGQALLCDSSGEVLMRWEASRTFATPPLAWTADGRSVLTAKGEGIEIRTLNADADQEPHVRGLWAQSPVVTLAVHPQRDLLVTGHDRSRAILWDLATGERVREHEIPDPWLPEDEDEVGWAAFSPDGKVLALSTLGGSHVFLLDVENGELLWTSEYLGAHFSEPLELAWTPDSSRIWYAFACGSGPVGSHALSPSARPEPYSGRGRLPRLGGELGLTITVEDAIRRVSRVHPPREPDLPQGEER